MDCEKLQKTIDKLYEILEANRYLSSTLNLTIVLERLLEKAKEVVEAEASSLMLLDEEKQELYFHTILGEKKEKLKDIRLKLGEGISGWAAQNQKSVLVEDCSKDPRFYRKADETSGFVTRSMMCVPLIFRNRVLGTIQVLNKTQNRSFDSEDLRIIEIMASQAAIAIENARLHALATIDNATGLYRKEYFLMRLKDEYRRFLHSNVPLSVLMSDIDYFKRINTEYGHIGGDIALKELANVILNVIHESKEDYVAGRYGGEEFCVIVPNSTEDKAMELAETIRKKIYDHEFYINDKKARITISIGISSLPKHMDYIQSHEDLIKLADEALYICKDRGRNCCAIFEK
ncbi:MAG: sensor domain-containing diguanylate cyclase [Leptospiraceae bacterium]|nr:sensor domain-containing diguanylate cyclase [Leptospiraceae bacterium]MDW7976141.1 sensor domain-containing diguanylate cyclase [Leptospiraceae bacterium]